MQSDLDWYGENRRKTPRERDKFYQVVVGLNFVCWLLFCAALMVFHYARPELISGVQSFWGVEGRTNWEADLRLVLIGILALCTLMGLTVLLMKRRRSRRKKDRFGFNLIFLFLLATASLVFVIVT